MKNLKRRLRRSKEEGDVKFFFEGLRDFEHIWVLDIEMLNLRCQNTFFSEVRLAKALATLRRSLDPSSSRNAGGGRPEGPHLVRRKRGPELIWISA